MKALLDLIQTPAFLIYLMEGAVYTFCQWLILGLMAQRTEKDGFWTMEQVRQHDRHNHHEKIACLKRHAGYWGCYGVAVLISYILVAHAEKWALPIVMPVGFICMAVVALGPVSAWAKATENNKLLEALARYELVSIPGVLNAEYVTFASAVFVLYFLTPGLGQMEIVLAAFLILCFLALGILMPSRETHKKITPTAGMFFIVLASLVIAITAGRLTYG